MALVHDGLLPPQHYEAGDPAPSKDSQLEESLRKQGRSKGGYFDWPFPAPTPCARNLNVAITELLLISDLSTPRGPWASGGGQEKQSSNETRKCANVQLHPPAQIQSNPVMQAWRVVGLCGAFTQLLYLFFYEAMSTPGAKGPHKPRAGRSQQAELPLELQICQ